MGKVPRVSGKEMVQFLHRQGFNLARVRGSHHYFEKGTIHTAVPVHGNRPLKIGTLHSILRDIEMKSEDFEEKLGA